MALTKEVTVTAAEKGERGGVKVEFQMRCFTDPAKTDLVIDQMFQGYIKSGVEGKTRDNLIQEAGNAVREKMQAAIDRYNAEETVLGSSKMSTMVTAIQGALTG